MVEVIVVCYCKSKVEYNIQNKVKNYVTLYNSGITFIYCIIMAIKLFKYSICQSFLGICRFKTAIKVTFINHYTWL